MTNETPAKILSLLGASLASLAFLFMVTVTNASFSGTQMQVPDPFAPEKVVALLDNVSNSYSNFVAANLVSPAKQDYAIAADNISWIAVNAKDGAVAMIGIQEVPEHTAVALAPATGRVAGAVTDKPYQAKYGAGIGLFSLLGIQ